MLIRCLVRKTKVEAFPEERVRQHLIRHMLDRLGYPLHLLAVELPIKEMPHLALSPNSFPDRRADVVCFANGIHPEHPLYPILLIECKAHPLGKEALRQVLGYNVHVQSPFVAVANQTEVKTSSGEGGVLINGLPTYESLIEKIGISKMAI